MSDNAELVRRLTEEGFAKGNLAVFDELLSEDFVSHDPPPGAPSNREGMKAVAGMVNAAFDDISFEFDEYIDAVDGRVTENWAMTGIHANEAFGMPASGKSVRVRGIEVWRCADGKIVEHWGSIDMSDIAEKAMGA
jgi:steroid delta-isomerase-like uncharacterized protein